MSGLSTSTMLAGFQRGQRHLVMRINRGDDRDRVDPRIRRQFAKLGRHLDTGMSPANKRQLFGVEVAEGNNPGTLQIGESAHQVQSPIAVANHRHAQGMRRLPGFSLAVIGRIRQRIERSLPNVVAARSSILRSGSEKQGSPALTASTTCGLTKYKHVLGVSLENQANSAR